MKVTEGTHLFRLMYQKHYTGSNVRTDRSFNVLFYRGIVTEMSQTPSSSEQASGLGNLTIDS